jgi:hypothetical protein
MESVNHVNPVNQVNQPKSLRLIACQGARILKTWEA